MPQTVTPMGVQKEFDAVVREDEERGVFNQTAYKLDPENNMPNLR